MKPTYSGTWALKSENNFFMPFLGAKSYFPLFTEAFFRNFVVKHFQDEPRKK